ECGIRESYRIDGEVFISAEDYCTGRVWADSYCYSFYPIDMHASDGGGIDTRPLQEGTLPTIPLRAMIPKGSEHLLVAGRCVSGDRTANSAFRVQASCMATGQVAGAVAALAAQAGTNLQSVPESAIVGLLRQHHAIVPDSITNSHGCP
ncbi:MAG: FAD-dependent oxidoreductase, partial [Puniceicoccales bacterium]